VLVFYVYAFVLDLSVTPTTSLLDGATNATTSAISTATTTAAAAASNVTTFDFSFDTEPAPVPSMATGSNWYDVQFVPSAAFVAYLFLCSVGNSQAQHPSIGLLGVASTALVVWSFQRDFESILLPTCELAVANQECDAFQPVRFFIILLLCVLMAVVAVLLLYSTIECFLQRQALTKRDVYFLTYAHDLLRRRGMHAPVALVRASAPVGTGNDSAAVEDDNYDVAQNDDADDDAAAAEDGTALDRLSPQRNEKRMRQLADADRDRSTSLPPWPRVKAELRASAFDAWHACKTSFRQSATRELFRVSDARVRYPSRLIVALLLSAIAFFCVLWTIVLSFGQIVQILNLLAAHTQSNGSRFVVETIARIVNGASLGGAALIAMALALTWLVTLRTYRRLLREMRRGIYHYRTPKLTNVTLFVGYSIVLQLALVVVVVVLAVIFAIVVCLAVFFPETVGLWVLSALLTSGSKFVIFYLARWIMSLFLLQSDGTRPDNYRCWGLIETFNLIAAVSVGPFIAVWRIVYMVAFACISFARLDVTMMPSGFASWDRAFMSFYAVVVLDHRVNNPILRAFLLLAANRHTSAVRPARVRRASERSPLLLESSSSSSSRDGDEQAADEDVEAAKTSRRRTVRNRWWLFVLLAQNPSLRALRQRGTVQPKPNLLRRLWAAAARKQ
jgi:hypothetical protein